MKTHSVIPSLLLMAAWAGGTRAHAQNPAPPSPTVVQQELKDGRSDAARDLKSGLIRYTITGQPRMTDPELKRIAAERYGITVVLIGCKPGPRVDYDKAYLETVIDHLQTKHGFNPITKIEQELAARQP